LLPCPTEDHILDASTDDHPYLRRLEQFSISANLIAYGLNWQQAAEAEDEFYKTDAVSFRTTKNRPLFAWQNQYLATSDRAVSSVFEMTTAAIGLAARRSLANDTKFLLLIAPSNLQVYADELPNDVLCAEMEAENSATDRLIRFAREKDIEFLDLRPTFIAAATRGEELYPEYDVHWTPIGNNLATNEVVDWLRAQESRLITKRSNEALMDQRP